MSDDIDRVQDAQAIYIAAAASRISAAIPAGVRGECDECGAEMPRLVGGRCGFCRDGRRPPLDRYPDLPPVPVADDRLDAPVVVQAATTPAPGVPIPEEEDAMPTPNCKVTIEGAAFEAVKARAAAQDVPLKQAACDLIELGNMAPSATNSISADVIKADVSDLSDDELLAELRSRLDGDATAISSAVARAQRAEEQLAAIRQTVLGLGSPS